MTMTFRINRACALQVVVDSEGCHYYIDGAEGVRTITESYFLYALDYAIRHVGGYTYSVV